MVVQASISFGSGCCNAPSKSDEEPPVPDSSRVRETQDAWRGLLLALVIQMEYQKTQGKFCRDS